MINGIDNLEVGSILVRAYNLVTRTGLLCALLVHERIDCGSHDDQPYRQGSCRFLKPGNGS